MEGSWPFSSTVRKTPIYSLAQPPGEDGGVLQRGPTQGGAKEEPVYSGDDLVGRLEKQ